ncbi:Protein BZZ1 [Yarrowia sp. B02]|nr:Protein BZZ1 [Yarrowia sp. B02]
MGDVQVSMGTELLDGWERVDNWSQHGIAFLSDVQSFYRERASIEKEYSQKLSSLSSKYFEKKAKVSSVLSVGEHPEVTPGSLESASLVTWGEILTQTETLAKEKNRLASELNLQVADQVHALALKSENVRKNLQGFSEKLLEDRDGYYSLLKKTKNGYYDACQAVENQRMKGQKGGALGGLIGQSKEKLERKLESKNADMNDAKNMYLVKINVANRLKDKYYHQDVPELLDRYQELNELRVKQLNGLLSKAASLEIACNERCTEHMNATIEMVAQNNPVLDSAMFTKHNIAPNGWEEPVDFIYEPCPIWHDDENMVLDDVALRYLHTVLGDSQRLSRQFEDTIASKEAGFQDLEKRKATKLAEADSNSASNNHFELLGQSINALRSLTVDDTKRTIAEVETETIKHNTGEKDLDSYQPVVIKKRHNFLFGKKKIDRNIPEASPVKRSNTTSSGFGGTGKLILDTLTYREGDPIPWNKETSALVLYRYEPQGSDEVFISENEHVIVLEADDGSGWIRVRKNDGTDGLVPASYVDMNPPKSATTPSSGGGGSLKSAFSIKRKGPPVAPKQGAKKVDYVTALYDYNAQDDTELTIKAGDQIVVVEPDRDGWTEGELNGQRGAFPTSYVE